MHVEQAVEDIASHYGQPAWLATMASRGPAQTVGLARLARGILQEGPLPEKIKHFMLFVIYVSQSKTDMARLHHAAAQKLGATAAEWHEVLMVFVPSRGTAMYIDGAAIVGLQPVAAPPDEDHALPTPAEMLDYFQAAMGQVPAFVSLLAEHKPTLFEGYFKLRSENLKDGVLPQKYKELMLVALNTAERYQRGAEIHARAALQCGASHEELLDGMTTAILAGGIPGWIEASGAYTAVTATPA